MEDNFPNLSICLSSPYLLRYWSYCCCSSFVRNFLVLLLTMNIEQLQYPPKSNQSFAYIVNNSKVVWRISWLCSSIGMPCAKEWRRQDDLDRSPKQEENGNWFQARDFFSISIGQNRKQGKMLSRFTCLLCHLDSRPALKRSSRVRGKLEGKREHGDWGEKGEREIDWWLKESFSFQFWSQKSSFFLF